MRELITPKRIVFLFAIMGLMSCFEHVYAIERDINAEQSSVVEVNSDIIDQYEERINTLIQQSESDHKIIEENQKIIEHFQSLYGTWTTIIAILLTIFGIIIPIVTPFLINRINKKELRDNIKDLKSYNNEQYEKMIKFENAVVLSNVGSYWASNKILDSLINKGIEDSYIKIFYAKNLFKLLEDADTDYRKALVNYDDNIYKAINLFIDSFYETNSQLIKDLMIGDVFPDSTIHEVSILIDRLAEDDDVGMRNDFIKICKKASRYILDVLNIRNEEELFDFDQSNVYIMIFKKINFHLCEIYYKSKNIALKEQLIKTKQLYEIDDFSQQDENYQKCIDMLNELYDE